jgi:hypothetical protein
MRIGSKIGAALAIAGAAVVTVAGPGPGTHDLAGGFFPRALAQAQDPNRDHVEREHEGRFEDWGKKIDEFNARAAERSSTARRELDEAWIEVKSGWAKLKSASREGWQDAKDALETSWRKLERAWNDAQS